MDGYIDREIRVFHRNREVVALVSVNNNSPTLRNAYIAESNDKGVVVFSGGAQRFYAYGDGVKPPEATIADIRINRGTALEIAPAKESVRGTLKKITASVIELKEWGLLTLCGRFTVYSVADGAVAWQSERNLLPGADMADYYIKDGVIVAGVITQSILPERVRVLINTSDFGGLIHSGVTVTANTPFTVTAGNTEKNFAAGQRFTVSDLENTDLFGQPRVYIHADQPNGRLQLVGLRRAWADNASPQYRGSMEIAAEGSGYVVINELSLEEYLYAVVPSEMPSGFGVEASKAQAVTARSYAFNQFYENRYRARGAHIEDSVLSQVYNNIPENRTAIEAVDATRGQCLTFGGQVISANFFSTSGGMTANSGEVWATGGRFPAPTPEYLRAQVQHEGGDFGDLRIEENAARFYKDTTVKGFDSHISWFRWNAHMTAEQIAASVNAGMNTRRQTVPSMILTDSDTIGELVDLQVIQRGEAGNIMEMRIIGTQGEVLVLAEYNIRLLLAPRKHGTGTDIRVTRKDGTFVNNMNLMPSAFFVMDKHTDEQGKLTAVTFHGGGFGHGVGMTQNGAKGMIDRGYSYREVLKHYYPGTEVKEMY
jgi:stage II sporulation protein D